MATEADGLVPDVATRSHPAIRRAATALFTLCLAGVDVSSSVLRFPPTVHGDGDNGFIAEAIGRHLGVPAASVAPGDAAQHFGHLGALASVDSPASADMTRELLGWEPTGPSLLEDLHQGHYFA